MSFKILNDVLDYTLLDLQYLIKRFFIKKKNQKILSLMVDLPLKSKTN